MKNAKRALLPSAALTTIYNPDPTLVLRSTRTWMDASLLQLAVPALESVLGPDTIKAVIGGR